MYWALSIRPKIPQFSKLEKIARKFPWKCSRKIRESLNFRNASNSSQYFGNSGLKNQMERKFLVTSFRNLG